ncbi:MAG: hypothetical protein RMK63_13125 [Thermus sp.]|nr:hypothetical protein [Thermus sp.]
MAGDPYIVLPTARRHPHRPPPGPGPGLGRSRSPLFTAFGNALLNLNPLKPVDALPQAFRLRHQPL